MLSKDHDHCSDCKSKRIHVELIHFDKVNAYCKDCYLKRYP